MKNILLLYGNAGSKRRFEAFLSLAPGFFSEREYAFHLPSLAGFEGTAEHQSTEVWTAYLNDLYKSFEGRTLEPWFIFAQGFGASLILELASRSWEFPSGYLLKPQKVILFAPAGFPSNFFYKRLMYYNPMPELVSSASKREIFRRFINKKLFKDPLNIHKESFAFFYEDYRNCAAFKTNLKLTDYQWIMSVKRNAWHQSFTFWFGDLDNLVPKGLIPVWQEHFPKSHFKRFEHWDHFPMISDTTKFATALKEEILG